ncbi:MAG TPA: hypothetical protein DCO75_04555 [Fibrobacteres bacterium]|jgi:hypothetical protein|nr:hypothetical protein [Fibrobacterota bacterium]
MITAKKLTEQITHTVKELPYEKQQEVYDFAAFLKNKTESKGNEGPQSSLNDLVGIIDGSADLASKHDEIYD